MVEQITEITATQKTTSETTPLTLDDKVTAKDTKCTRLKELISAEMEFILRHEEKHRWYRNIADRNLGTADFVINYMFPFREAFCGYGCSNRRNCAIAERYNKDLIPKTPSTEQ